MNVEELLKLKNKRFYEIDDKKKEILELEKHIKDINRILWKNCNHEWVRVPNSERDLLKRRCKKCELWDHAYLYK